VRGTSSVRRSPSLSSRSGRGTQVRFGTRRNRRENYRRAAAGKSSPGSRFFRGGCPSVYRDCRAAGSGVMRRSASPIANLSSTGETITETVIIRTIAEKISSPMTPIFLPADTTTVRRLPSASLRHQRSNCCMSRNPRSSIR